jgi:hypothetical protein
VDGNGEACPLTGDGFVVSGTLAGVKVKYPKGAVVTGSLVLICED